MSRITTGQVACRGPIGLLSAAPSMSNAYTHFKLCERGGAKI